MIGRMPVYWHFESSKLVLRAKLEFQIDSELNNIYNMLKWFQSSSDWYQFETFLSGICPKNPFGNTR